MHITARLARLFAWGAFAVVHLILVVVALALLWAYQVHPGQVAVWVHELLRNSIVSSTLGTLGFLGIGILGALAVYIRIWQKALQWLTSRYVLKDFD
ncbi:hypothetical protein C6V08_00510 [Burkholderia gladioli]|nr:hypothetical protein C6V08_00510 [Burkholderia gladioli]